MNRGQITTRPELSAGYAAYGGIAQQGLAAGTDQTTPGALLLLIGIPRSATLADSGVPSPLSALYPLQLL